MCGRYYRRSDKQHIAEAFKLGKLPEGLVIPGWDYNVAPTTFQPVIRQVRDASACGPGEPTRELRMMRWGLVPYFAKSLADFKGFSTINAKAESLMTKAMWRVPFQRRRCLIPADGFYEWRKLDAKTKQPWAFSMANGQPFAFAGLWDRWKDPAADDAVLESFTIITTDPNELTAKVHNRMPVILAPRDYDRWLTREPGSAEGMGHGQPPLDLLRPYPADAMTAHKASRDVGNVRNNHPELLNSK